MTYSTLTKAGFASLAFIGLSATLPAASAMAADGNYVASSASSPVIRAASQAFNRGDYKESAALSRAALQSSLSKRKTAIAQSNLCAAYAKLEMFDEASEACEKALELHPGYEPAEKNQAQLTIRLASLK